MKPAICLMVLCALLAGRATAAAPVPAFQHVVVIVFENKESPSVLGNRAAPTFNAYARRYAIWGREADTINGLLQLDTAKSIHDVDRAMAKVTWNENTTAADDRGHIGYWHPGLLPLKPLGWDERLPYPGTGEAEWRGLMTVNQRPHAIDPKQGYLFNWNNMPSTGWTGGDAPDRNRMTGKYHHADFLGLKVREAARHFSFDNVRGVDRLTGTISPWSCS